MEYLPIHFTNKHKPNVGKYFIHRACGHPFVAVKSLNFSIVSWDGPCQETTNDLQVLLLPGHPPRLKDPHCVHLGSFWSCWWVCYVCYLPQRHWELRNHPIEYGHTIYIGLNYAQLTYVEFPF